MSIRRSEPVFWGWYVVFSSFVMLTLIYGVRYSFGVFVKPMFAEYSWPMAVISLAASINLVMYASGGVFAGWLLVVCNVFAVMTVMMTFVHQVAYAINNGIDKLEAAAAIGFIGIMGIGGALGPILGGFIFDKTGSYRSGWIMNTIFMLIISLLILALKPSQRPGQTKPLNPGSK